MRTTCPNILILIGTYLFSTSVLAQGSSVERPPVDYPDYREARFWAALPEKIDAADLVPNGLEDRQVEAPADVFFIHPTTYTKRRKDKPWNGSLTDPKLRERTDSGTIKFQASVFNGAAKVYAPYYRQAHLEAYFTEDTASARRAFDLAYEDVRAAFQYYLDTYNDGRPIIIASHSQGTTHGKRLVKEFFDGKPLADQLVAAYLIGIPVEKSLYEALEPCEDSTQTGCLISWRTWKRGTEPRAYDPDVIVTNPLSWTTDGERVPASANSGGIARPFEVVRPELTDAQVYKDILWAEKPKFPGSFLFNRNNYHIADLNFYYVNVRNNARRRIDVFLNKE